MKMYHNYVSNSNSNFNENFNIASRFLLVEDFACKLMCDYD